jgi:hypothetical protein
VDGITGEGITVPCVVGVALNGLDGIAPADKDEDVTDAAEILIEESADIAGLWELCLALPTAIEYPCCGKPRRAPGIGTGGLNLVLRKYPLHKAGTPGDAVFLANSAAVFGHGWASIIAADFALSDFGERSLDELCS